MICFLVDPLLPDIRGGEGSYITPPLCMDKVAEYFGMVSVKTNLSKSNVYIINNRKLNESIRVFNLILLLLTAKPNRQFDQELIKLICVYCVCRKFLADQIVLD